MKKNKILAVIISVCVVCGLAAVGVYANMTPNKNFIQWGEKQEKIKEETALSTKAIAKVNGIEIPKEKFDSYKTGLTYASKAYSDDEIIDKIVNQEVIMQEIKRLGYTVTDEEVTKFNDERFALLEEDPKSYQVVKDYVDGLGISLEEYKEMSKEISKVALLSNKYKADILREFETNSQVRSLSQEMKAKRFDEYFDKKIKTLTEDADIEILK